MANPKSPILLELICNSNFKTLQIKINQRAHVKNLEDFSPTDKAIPLGYIQLQSDKKVFKDIQSVLKCLDDQKTQSENFVFIECWFLGANTTFWNLSLQRFLCESGKINLIRLFFAY
jgi:hypothetical protein